MRLPNPRNKVEKKVNRQDLDIENIDETMLDGTADAGTIAADDDTLDDEEQQLYEHFRLVVDKGQEPERIDKYLFVRMQHSSRNRIQKRCRCRIHTCQRPAGEEQL